MGKSVAPRAEPEAVDVEKRDDEGTSNVAKRDLTGFNRALQYAEAALTKGPKIQLGTESAGVGIIVDNNVQAASKVSTAKAKREVAASPRVKVTTMYVRSGIPNCEYRPFSSTCLTISSIAGKREDQTRAINLVGTKQDTDIVLLDQSSSKR